MKDGFHFFQAFPRMWSAQERNEWDDEGRGDDSRKMTSLCDRMLLLVYAWYQDGRARQKDRVLYSNEPVSREWVRR